MRSDGDLLLQPYRGMAQILGVFIDALVFNMPQANLK